MEVISNLQSIYTNLKLPRRIVSITQAQGEFLYHFLKDNNIKKTMEVGFCYGCSAAYIISSTMSPHYAIDPHQSEVWGDVGWENLRQLNLEKFLHLENDFSYGALPKLVKEGHSFDFCFIDGDHKFEAIMLDFYYCDRLLNMSGYLAFDDTYLRASQVVEDWITTNRKDYVKVDISQHVSNLLMFKKVGRDERGMEDFNEFYHVSPRSTRNPKVDQSELGLST